MSKFVAGDDNLDDDTWQATHKDIPQKTLEPVDNRSLFEKLQEQKAAKEDALNEATKFSNLIRRLDNDEIDFLAGVHEQRDREEARSRKEREAALEKFRLAQRAVDREDATRHQESALRQADSLNMQQSVKRRRIAVTGVVKNKGTVEKDVTREIVLELPNSESSKIDHSRLVAYDSESDEE